MSELRIAHRSGMCSTLTLSACPARDLPTAISYFKQYLNKWKKGGKERVKEKVYDAWSGNRYEEQDILDGYDIRDYAFIVCTTMFKWKDNEYFEIRGAQERDVLTSLGFTTSEPSYNKKNNTTVCLHCVSVPALIEKLDKYDDKGQLLEVEVQKECAA